MSKKKYEKNKVNYVRRLTGRMYNSVERKKEIEGLEFVKKYNGNIILSYDEIENITKTARPWYYWKAIDLLTLLEQHKPKHLVELGSGRTTAVFAAYAAKHGAKLTVFEQDERWISAVKSAVRHVTDDPLDIRKIDCREVENGGRFDEDIPASADFIYVDAPSVPKTRVFESTTGKPIAFDSIDFIKAGHRPLLIVVDGRTCTVDELLDLPEIRDGYTFKGEVSWAQERAKLFASLQMNRHSVFLR